jgi:mannosyltransferase OCH1-like enzyme
MPDYEIRVWDANSFDFDSVPFVRDAYKAKKWAFVADYIRLYALYTEGGIYLDSDVKVFKRFDEFLDNDFFIGSQPYPGNKADVESAIMGSVPGHPYLKECLEHYQALDFKDRYPIPKIMSELLEKYGYRYADENQLLPNGVKVYDMSYFGHYFGTAPGEYYAIHYYYGSWGDIPHSKLYYWCYANDFANAYKRLEKATASFRKHLGKLKSKN